MSLQHILQTIADDAEQQARAILQEAQARREARLAEAQQQADALRAQILAEAEAEAEQERARLLHRARLERMRKLVAVQETAFQAALQRARDRLAQTRGREDYPAIFAALLREALAAQEPGAVVHVAGEDRDLARRVLNELGQDAPLTGGLSAWGGVEVHSPDDRIITLNTLESRLSRAEPDLRPLLADLLKISDAKDADT